MSKMAQDRGKLPVTPVPESTTQQATQLQYEDIMQHSRSYLQRRDLASYDDIPLYFAWERLYATANANLSIDFISENQLEFSQRREARLAPRRGMASSFASFDGRNRKSALASSYLRSAPSPSVVRLMAHRYREGAAKMRSMRASAAWVPLATEKLGQKEKRKRRKRRSKAILEEIEEELRQDKTGCHFSFKEEQFPAAEVELSHPSSFSSEESDEQSPLSGDPVKHSTRASRSTRSVSGSSAKDSVYAVKPSALLASDLSPVKKHGTFSAIERKAANQHDINVFNFVDRDEAQPFPYATVDDKSQFAKHKTSTKTPMTKLFLASRNAAEEVLAADFSSPTSSRRHPTSQLYQATNKADTIDETQTSSFYEDDSFAPHKSKSQNQHRMSTRKASAASSDGHFDVAEYDEDEDDEVVVPSAEERRGSSRAMAVQPTQQQQQTLHRKQSSVSMTMDGYADGRGAVQDDRRASRAPGSKEQHQHRMSTRKASALTLGAGATQNVQRSSSRLSVAGCAERNRCVGAISQLEPEGHQERFPGFDSRNTPPEVVWPPGMASSAKSRRPGSHHPIVPPGMEYLVTDEQWKGYWTWLNWYSAWQVWYLKDSKSKKKKAKDQEQRNAASEAESTASSSRSRAESPRSANWWLDVSAKKKLVQDDRCASIK